MGEDARRKPGYATLAAIVIVMGISGLMGINLLWPVIFILLPGLVLLWLATAGGTLGALLFAVPGTLVAGTGALMFLQNLTGYWESWAYAWTLYGPFLGLGFAMMGQRIKEPGLITVGRWLVYAGVASFALFGLLFELIFFQSGGPLVPVLLIAAGLYLFSQSGGGKRLLTDIVGSLDGDKTKRKMKAKPKREDKLFTGPVVYGSTLRQRDGAQVAVLDMDDISEQRG
jgi:hypothetical protein